MEFENLKIAIQVGSGIPAHREKRRCLFVFSEMVGDIKNSCGRLGLLLVSTYQAIYQFLKSNGNREKERGESERTFLKSDKCAIIVRGRIFFRLKRSPPPVIKLFFKPCYSCVKLKYPNSTKNVYIEFL